MSSERRALEVVDLSKSYTIRHHATDHVTLAEVALDRLTHPFRRVAREQLWALRDVSFRLSAGSVLGLIGANGAGKSTLLKVLSRITEPSAGHVRIWGRVGSLLEVGTGFHPELTGRENIYLNGAVLGMRRHEVRRNFDAIVEFASIERFLDTPMKRFSSGMQVRLAFAVAAHLDTDIVILDEVLAVGDRDFQQKSLQKISALATDGRTVVLVSHNLDTIRRYASEGLLLQAGRVRAFGGASEVVEEYMASVASTAPVSLDARPRVVGYLGRRARIVSALLKFEAPDPPEGHAVLRISVVLATTEDLERVLLQQVLRVVDGPVVGASFSEPCITLRSKRSAEVEFLLECPRLAPGTYSIGLLIARSLGRGGLDDLDAIDDCVQFDIGEEFNSHDVVGHWDLGWGALRMNPPEVTSIRDALDT